MYLYFGEKMNKYIEFFKILQRIIMVVLTIILIIVMNKMAIEIKDMKNELNRTATIMEQMKDGINNLSKILKDSIWF